MCSLQVFEQMSDVYKLERFDRQVSIAGSEPNKEAHMSLKIRDGLFEEKAKTRTWKNVGLLHKTLQELKDRGTIPSGGDIDTAKIEIILRDNGLHSNWDLSLNPDDEHGLLRSIGDTIGGHGLGLKKTGRSRHYVMPDTLPTVQGDTVITEAVYTDPFIYGKCPECGGPGVTTERRPDGDSTCAKGHKFKRNTGQFRLPSERSGPETVGRLAHLYNVALTEADGIYSAKIVFEGVPYQYATSSFEQMLETLNPVACNKDHKALSKDEVRKAINSTPCTVFANPSIYQKLYGAHSPDRSRFQKATKSRVPLSVEVK